MKLKSHESNVRMNIRPARSEDFNSITQLLKKENLPVADLLPELPHFFLVEERGKVLGAIGLEIYGEKALLRSLIVHAGYRNKSLASQLLETMLLYAEEGGIKTLFLITTTAETYFSKKGFEKIDRDTIPAPIAGSTEFSTFCPSTAFVMRKELNDKG